MEVLLVEDDENKAESIQRFLSTALPTVSVELRRSMHSALKELRSRRPDLVLLDMNLPTFDVAPNEVGGSPRIFGGREILRQLDRLRIAVPVIMVTQFETFEKDYGVIRLSDVDAELKNAHTSNYIGSVYYHAAINDWKSDLLALIARATDAD